MKVSKIALIILLLGSVSVLSLSCAAKSDSAVSENQIVTVRRGNLTVDITAAGNLALSRTEDLAFDVFYAKTTTKATVKEVLVVVGDSVKEGQVLATLDTSEWADQLKALEDKVEAADRQVTALKRALLQAELNQIDAETALQDAEASYVWPAEIYAARAAVWDAESQVEEAQAVLRGNNLIYDRNTKQYRYQELLTAWDIKVWSDKLTAAEETLTAARVKLDNLLAQSVATVKVKNAEERLSTAQVKLAELLAESTPDAKNIEIQKTKVELAQEQLTNAQNTLTGVTKKRLQVEQAKGNVEDAQQKIDDEEKVLVDAQKALDDAKTKSPIITAPFAGFITKVNVKGGDEVLNGAVAVQLADPNKFEANILVNETDMLQVKLGGDATVQVDSIPGLTLPAKLTQISPTATIQSGVVNYQVKVEIESLQPVTANQRGASDNSSSANISSPRQPTGGSPSSGNVTSPRQRTGGNQSSDNVTPPRQWTGGNPFSGNVTSQGQAPAVASENFQLREGLSITVSVIIQERNDVLLVPNGAITLQRGQSYVQVQAADGTTEQRAIQTGINNAQYTEVTSGLTEGEKVIVPRATTSSTTSSTTQQGGVIRIPGIGGLGR